jgi:hypothetical protein
VASTNIKRIVGDVIAAYISSAIPTLNGNVKAAQAGPEENFVAPAVRIMPQATVFEPSNGDEIYSAAPDDGKVVYQVGDFTGLFQLELWAKTKPERELFEQAILDLFIADPWAPGTLILNTPTLTINGYVSLYGAEIKVRLDQEEWQEELAFEGHRYTFLNLEIDFPALTSANAVQIQHLQSVFSSNLETIEISLGDTVEVQADGSVTHKTGFSSGFSTGFGA